MKVKIDIGDDLELPKVIEDDLKKEWEKAKADYKNIEDFLESGDFETILDYLDECDGKIVDKELALFLRDWETGIIPAAGGYPTSEAFMFEEKGTQYTILAFGWLNEKYDHLYMVGYKETGGKNG